MSENSAQRPYVDGITNLPTRSSNFIRTWLEVMRPFHKLTSRQMDFAAALLEERYAIAERVTDKSLVDKLLFDEETKERIREKTGISKAYMHGILRTMRDNGMIIGNGKKISPEYLPTWKKGKPFRMLFVFRNED